MSDADFVAVGDTGGVTDVVEEAEEVFDGDGLEVALTLDDGLIEEDDEVLNVHDDEYVTLAVRDRSNVRVGDDDTDKDNEAERLALTVTEAVAVADSDCVVVGLVVIESLADIVDERETADELDLVAEREDVRDGDRAVSVALGDLEIDEEPMTESLDVADVENVILPLPVAGDVNVPVTTDVTLVVGTHVNVSVPEELWLEERDGEEDELRIAVKVVDDESEVDNGDVTVLVTEGDDSEGDRPLLDEL